MNDNGRERLGIQSVEIAGKILEALAEGGGAMFVRDLAVATGMHRGKIHRYLSSLTRSGLVEQDAADGRYEIGPLAITLGLVGLRRSSAVQIAYDALPRIRDRLDETVALIVWGQMGATVVALEEQVSHVTLNVRVGSVLPILTSAVGRVFAAYLSPSVTAEVIRREREEAAAEGRTVPDERELPAILETVREHGMAAIRGTLIPGLNAIAAPVFDHRGRIAFVLGVVARQEALEPSMDNPSVVALLDEATALSRRLGHDGAIEAAE